MRRIFYSLIALLMLAAPVSAQQTKAALNTEVSSNLPDNTTGLITPAILRTTVNDFIASWQQAPRVNAQTGATYTFAVGDYGLLVTFNNAAPVAVTLPQATGSFATWNAYACNLGAGAVTITPTVSTIGGSATLVIQQNQCRFIISDATNYQLFGGVVQPVTCAASNWIRAITSLYVPTCSQPAASDLSNGTTGTGAVALAGSPTFTGTLSFSTLSATSLESSTSTVTGLTINNTPNNTNDYVPYYSAGDGKIRRIAVGSLASAAVSGVSSLNGLTGALSVVQGTGLSVTAVGSSVTVGMSSARATLPTTQTFTAGSSLTYTTPANALWLEVHLVGGGGGGQGGGVGNTGITSGAATTFSTASAGGGASAGGAAGVTSGCTLGVLGTLGHTGTPSVAGGVTGTGGSGGNAPYFNGGGTGGNNAGTGGAGQTNTGGGGGGGGMGNGSADIAGTGGTSGSYCYVIINSPAASYTYTVGAGGNGGTAGAGANGGAGAAGRIFVIEHYNS